MVRTNNVLLSTADAAVILLKGTKKALSVKTDCNGRYVYLNPRLGGKIAVAESARNVVCTGARPLAITNCLNFGNPYKPGVFWQFKEAVAGIGEACRAFNTPVTGGNVSFYNESPYASVYPTPVIGMLGLIEDVSTAISSQFKSDGDVVILLGKNSGHIGGSEYLATIHGQVMGDAPGIDLDAEKKLHGVILEAAGLKLLVSAHDCSDGGLAVALAECCMGDGGLGAGIEVPADGVREDMALFGEDQSRVIVSARPGHGHRVLEIARKFGVPAETIGRVGGSRLTINSRIDLEVGVLAGAYFEAIERKMVK
jgi:phosphoribosylformylglycinamidine synthase